jgi:hypothetical protein
MLLLPRVGGGRMVSDLLLYRNWARGILDWSTVPYRDFGWEYPPGAALVMTPPALFGDYYKPVFVLLMLLADFAVLRVLMRLADRLGSDRGIRVWLAGTLLMGPILFARYDVVSALLALLAVLAVVVGAPLTAGFALGGGIVTKLWPALLVLALPYVRGRARIVAGAGAVVVAAVVAVLAIGGSEHGRETFERHSRRGLQVESVAATPVVVAQRAGAAVDISYYRSSGSWDVTGTGAAAALTATSVLTLVALGTVALLAWRTRRVPETWPDLVATALLLLTVAGKVLSPQYVIWLLAVFAAALSRRGSPLWLPGAIVAGSAVLGQWVYPAYYFDLVNGGGTVVVVMLVLRNLALVVAAVLAVSLVWRRTATP